MILYTEKQLEDYYREYRLQHNKKNVGVLSLEDFRVLFEEFMNIIYKDKI